MRILIRNLLLLVLITLPLSQLKATISGIPVYLPEALISVASVIFLAGLLAGRISWRAVPRMAVFGSVLFMIGACVSSWQAGIDVCELGALKSWILFPIVFGTLIYQNTLNDKERKQALQFFFSGCVLTAVVSILPLPFLRVTYDGRLSSFFPSPNHLAMFMAPGVVLGTYFTIAGFRDGARLSRAFVFVSSVAIAIVLVRTGSAGAIIGVSFGVMTLLTLLFQPGRSVRRAIGTVCVAAALIAAIVIGASWKTLGSGEVRSSLASRVMIWNASYRMILDRPIVGIGLRNFEREYLSLQGEFPPYLEWAVPHPHNVILAVWLQTGLIGLMGFLLLLMAVARIVRKTVFEPKTREESVAVLAACLTVILAHGLVDTPLFRNDLSLSLFSVCGLILSAAVSVSEATNVKIQK